MAGRQLPYFRMFVGLIFGITMAYTVDFVGALRLGEILAIPYLFMFVPRFFSYFKRDKLLQYSLITITCWILIQLASDWHNQTQRIDILKGTANLAVAASSFIFLVVVVRKDVSVLLVILIGRFIGNLFFREMLQTSSEEIMSNEYWDLRVGIWAGPIVLFLGLLLVNRMRPLVAIGFMIYGAAAIAFGGRSHGLVFCFAGISVLLLPHVKRRIAAASRRTLTRQVIAGSVALALIYPIFVYVGLQGHITSKTEQQLKDANNPYNPIEVVLGARGGLQNGLNAIKRRPIAGYGSRAYLGDYLPGLVSKLDYNYIHSTVMESGAFGGIGALACCLFLYFLILKQCLKLASFSNAQCNLIASYVAISQTWSFFFNPLSSFRLFWPLAMIMIWCLDVEQKPKDRVMHVSPDQRRLNPHAGRSIEN